MAFAAALVSPANVQADPAATRSRYFPASVALMSISAWKAAPEEGSRLLPPLQRMGRTSEACPRELPSLHPSPVVNQRRRPRGEQILLQVAGNSSNGLVPPEKATIGDYIQAIRPTTCLQAVGALVLGYLALRSDTGNAILKGNITAQIVSASISVYLSYGAGMVMNDAVDVSHDSLHESKNQRAIASGRISRQSAWTYCALLTFVSMVLGSGKGWQYFLWNTSNLLLMMTYALGGLQKVLLMKNIVCGYLAISPLMGASFLMERLSTTTISTASSSSHKEKLLLLAIVGFPMHVAREILKDAEDVDIDRGNKQTLPLLIGELWSRRVAYSIIASVCSFMLFTKHYWRMFASNYPIYPLGVALGLPMCIWASALPLSQGQCLLKKSIYVILAGMIGGILAR